MLDIEVKYLEKASMNITKFDDQQLNLKYLLSLYIIIIKIYLVELLRNDNIKIIKN